MQDATSQKLDDVHSILVTAAEEGDTSAVLATIASVLGSLAILDKPASDPNYWRDVMINLNMLADSCASEAEAGSFDDLSEEDWALMEALDDESSALDQADE